MKIFPALVASALSLGMVAHADQGIELNPQPFLDSDEFQELKAEYQRCVLRRGEQLLDTNDFETAVKYAPTACRRDLLKIKRLMLGSAFKVEVADGLLASIAEGVEIDLVNALLDKQLGDAR